MPSRKQPTLRPRPKQKKVLPAVRLQLSSLTLQITWRGEYFKTVTSTLAMEDQIDGSSGKL
jgi:hypothetical protein